MPRHHDPRLRALAFTVLLGLIATGWTFWLVQRAEPFRGGPFLVSGWVIAIFVTVLSLQPLNVEVGKGGMFFELSEIAVVVALFCTPRPELIRMRLLSAVVLWTAMRWRSPLKVFFNTAQIGVATCFAIAVFDSFGTKSITNPKSWIAAAAGAIAYNLTLHVGVRIVLRLSGEPIRSKDAGHVIRSNAVQLIITTSFALTALLMLTITWASVVLLGAMVIGAFAASRDTAELRVRLKHAETLRHYVESLEESPNVDETIASVLTATANATNASSVELVLLGPESRHVHGTFPKRVRRGDWLWSRVLDGRQPTLLLRRNRSRKERSYLLLSGSKDLIAAPIMRDGDAIGMLVAADHRFEAATFGRDDLELLELIAEQASVTLHNRLLMNRLRTEAETRFHEAMHDPLTGLANRLGFVEHADRAVADASMHHPVALVFIDLNDFKSVNDTYGHHAGDRLLIELATRIKHELPSTWAAGRLGGDEFALLGQSTDFSEVEKILQSLAREFHRPTDLDGTSYRTQASFGYAVAPLDAHTREDLMRYADRAMYAAKADTSLPFVRYRPDLEETSAREMQRIADLREAVENGEISAQFQPKAALSNGEIVGVDVLARWNHPKLGDISPNEFIPLARRAGLLDQLTLRVVDHALQADARWTSVGLDFTIGVRVEVETLKSHEFSQALASLLTTRSFDPTRLTLEVSEVEIGDDAEATIATMNEYRAFGVRFSVGDFGGSRSSLKVLTTLPLDEVMINRELVGNAAESVHEAAIVKAIIDVADTRGIDVVANGVEDTRAWDTVRNLRCNMAQGYYLSKPLTAQALEEWMALREGLLLAPVIGLHSSRTSKPARSGSEG